MGSAAPPAGRLMARRREIEMIVQALPPLAERGPEFRYTSLPFCVLDAIFSINARYGQVQNVIQRYADHYRLPVYRPTTELLPREAQVPISDLVEQIDAVGPVVFAADIVRNRGRTSPRGGILKAEASLRFARVLAAEGIETMQDMGDRRGDASLEAALRRVHGQKSGVAVAAFFMLAGDETLLKPDRMVLRFLERTLGRRVTGEEAQELLRHAAAALCTRGHPASVGVVDYTIWQAESRR
jgi:hypothetical protein